MPTTGLDLGDRKTFICYLKANGEMGVVMFGEQFAWIAMQGKHWIVQAHSREAAFDKAELMYLDEEGVPEQAEKYQHIVKRLSTVK